MMFNEINPKSKKQSLYMAVFKKTLSQIAAEWRFLRKVLPIVSLIVILQIIKFSRESLNLGAGGTGSARVRA